MSVCLTAAAQTTTIMVGSGAPNQAIAQSFISAFYRSGFNNLVTLPPLGNVRSLGTQGLVQEFADAKNSANKYALIKSNVNQQPLQGGADMFQAYPALYAYYTSVGANTAGYPTTDTLPCPNLVSLPANGCQYQIFDKPYALFAYQTPLLSGSANFALANPFLTAWQSLGGINTLGPATSASATVTAASSVTATTQTFDQGELFSITSGPLNGQSLNVGPGIYPVYAANGGYGGFLGLPTGNAQVQANGDNLQNFENGSIDYNPSTGLATLRYPISSITLSISQSITLSLGDTITVTASVSDINGNPLTDRTIVWSTSNSRVVSIQPNGLTATVKAIGGGTATLTASGGGKASTPLTIIVTAPCCAVGEGAPTPTIQQAFQDAVTRTKLNFKLPTAQPVTRSGNGYVQYFQDASTGTPYLLAFADGGSAAYLVAGVILAKYQTLGGPAGSLGYPAGDTNANGRQMFLNNAALAGNPVQMVAGAFLNKWASLGYETGVAGNPTSAPTSVLTFRATMGTVQSFANGSLASAQTGSMSGKVFFISGLIAAAYAQSGGATGTLGLPIGDEVAHRQDFEGGYIDYSSGDSAAQIHNTPRNPLITATPATVLAGTRVRLAVGGFDPGATIRVSATGQADFVVTTNSGAYAWEVVVPSTSKSGTVSIRAVDTSTSASATGSYTVKAPSEFALQLTKLSGDGQTGLPGATLVQPLTMLARDSAGNVLAGVPVQFSPSPGAQIVSSSVVTASDGTARAIVRLSSSDGLSLINGQAGTQTVTFSAQSIHGSFSNFPSMVQTADAGSLVASAAAILRFYQNRGSLPTPHGFADPTLLNQFLKGFCTVDAKGGQICDGYLSTPDSQAVPNLWRLSNFAGGNLDVSIEKPDPAVVRDLLNQGTPVLLTLSGGRYVVATGVASDGGVSLMDPNPSGQVARLDPSALLGAVRLLVRPPAQRAFVLAGNTDYQVYSPAGLCGNAWKVQPSYTMIYCDGMQDSYELNIAGGAYGMSFTDLDTPNLRADLSGAGGGAFSITRSGSNWSVAPQTLSFSAAGVVNAASFLPGLAPGTIFTVFGSGLARSGTDTTVQLDGTSLQTVAQNSFQLSAVMPLDIGSGQHNLTLNSAYGIASQGVTLSDVAPAIFLVGSSQGAILNQNGTLNGADNPAKRGETIVIFGTGCGAVTLQNQLNVVNTTVSVSLNGTVLNPAFAGLSPGFVGLYQVNVLVPLSTPPGVALPLSIQQAGISSNPATVAIQ
jgi:uncharacterized protein (TIGR03437 family)